MARGRIITQDDEVEPAQVAGELIGGDPATGAEEILQPRMPVIHGLDVKLAAEAFTERLVEDVVADAESGGAGRVDGAAVGDQRRHHRTDRAIRSPRENSGLVLDAMCWATFGLWRLVRQHDVCGIMVSHVLDERDDGEQTWIVDEGLEATAAPGTCLAARLCRVEPFSLFAGASMRVSRAAVETALLALPARRYQSRKNLADDPKLPAAIYRAALQHGVFDNIA